MKIHKWIKEFKKEKIEIQLLIVCWLAILFFSPCLTISSYIDRNPIALGLGLGLTMFFYWITGLITALLKGWRIDE